VSCTVTAFAASGMLPARGRFTAVAGTFASWQVNAPSTVAGSALGWQGAGGNNTMQFWGNAVYAKATDGSWIELAGAFVAEGPRDFTLSHGPLPIMALAEEMISKAFAACAPLQLLPWPALIVCEQGESDLGLAVTYKAKAKEVLLRLVSVFGKRPKGQEAVPKVIVQLSARTPLGTDSELTTIRAAQAELAVDPDLPNTASRGSTTGSIARPGATSWRGS